jgi:hypothetical protein
MYEKVGTVRYLSSESMNRDLRYRPLTISRNVVLGKGVVVDTRPRESLDAGSFGPWETDTVSSLHVVPVLSDGSEGSDGSEESYGSEGSEGSEASTVKLSVPESEGVTNFLSPVNLSYYMKPNNNVNECMLNVMQSELPYGIVLQKGKDSKQFLYKFNYHREDITAIDFLHKSLFNCLTVDHAIQMMNPLLQSDMGQIVRNNSSTYDVSLLVDGKPLSIAVEHGEVKEMCHSLQSSVKLDNVLVAKNCELSLHTNVLCNSIMCEVRDSGGDFLASIAHDWSPFADLVQVSKCGVSQIRGMQTLLQQKTRMIHPTSCIASETNSIMEMYNTSSNRLEIAVSIIKAMKLTNVRASIGHHHKWVNDNCEITTSTAAANYPLVQPKAREKQGKITCIFSGSVRYAIAHVNKDITNVLMSKHGMTIDEVTSVLMAGIGSCKSRSIPECGFQFPCKVSFVVNNTDLQGESGSAVELRRMNACRHAMGTNLNTFKIVQKYIDHDIYVHICNTDNGSCVFSIDNMRNIVSVSLSQLRPTHSTSTPTEVSNTVTKPPVYSVRKMLARKKETEFHKVFTNTTSSYRQNMAEVEDVPQFSMRNAAIQLAHINAACLQNPDSSLKHSHHYLRSCWFSKNMQKLRTLYPTTENNVEYCATASKLGNMAKLPLYAAHYWCMVPFAV